MGNIKDTKFVCKLCKQEFLFIRSLSAHIRKEHSDIGVQGYYDRFLKSLNDGVCKICGKPTKFLYLSEGYDVICVECRDSIPKNKVCVVCGKIFKSRDYRSICCGSKNCENAILRMKYKSDTVECICDKCNKKYTATPNQRKDRCPECVKKYKVYSTQKTFTQILGCKYCGKGIKEVTKHCSPKQAKALNYWVCEDCKRVNRERVSNKMKLNNPSYKGRMLTLEEYKDKKELEDYYNSEEYKIKRSEEVKRKNSERMKTNNPMYRKEVRDKTSHTLKSRYKNGTIPKRKGKDHWLYKGNRSLNTNIRTSLSEWRISNLVRSDYTCEVCGKRGGRLHIHHKKPLRDIIDLGLKELGIDKNTLVFRDDNYQMLESWVLNFHNTQDIGLVVCKDCHDKIDSYYHKSKNA